MSIIRIPLGQNISYIAFNGEINFDFKTPALKWCIPSKSTIVVRLRVTQSNSAGTAILPGLRPLYNTVDTGGHPTNGVTIPYLNKNPISTLFTGVKCSIGEHIISNDDYVQCGDTMYKMLTRSKDEQKTVEPNNSIEMLSREQCSTIANIPLVNTNFNELFPDFDNTNPLLFSKRDIYAMNNLYGLNYNHEIELEGSIPCPLFNAHDPIPPHTPINLKFVIDGNNYHTNLINFAGAITSGINGYPTPSIAKMTSQDSQLTTPNCIAVGVLDISLYLYCEQRNDLISKVHNYRFVNYSGVYKTLSQAVSSDNQQFNFPRNRNISFISCAFTQQQSTIKNAMTDFGVRFDPVVSVSYSSAPVTTAYNNINVVVPTQTGEIVNYGAVGAIPLTEGFIKTPINTTSPILNLQQISILFNGSTIPDTPYHFNFFNSTASSYIDDGVNDLARAYQEYVNCYIDQDRCGRLMTFSEWTVCPIFCFKTGDILPANMDNVCYVNLWYRSNAVKQVYMYVSAYYVDELKLKYDDNAQFSGLLEII